MQTDIKYCLSVRPLLQTDKAGFSAAKGGCNRLLAGLPLGAGWLLESLLTFLLVFVVFTATDQARAQSTAHLPILAPAGIGFAVFVCHLAAVALDGCSINRKLHLPTLTHLCTHLLVTVSDSHVLTHLLVLLLAACASAHGYGCYELL